MMLKRYGSSTTSSRRFLQAALRCNHKQACAQSQYSQSDVRSIAILGGGLAGLTLALHLARNLLQGGRHRIALYEAQDRFGGWVRSDNVSVKGKEKEAHKDGMEAALVEAGPRSIRPAALPGLAMLDLINSLDLAKELICVPKTHPSAKNRFLYYAGKLHLLPSSIMTALRTMLFDRGHPLSKAKIPSTIIRSLLKPRDPLPQVSSSARDRWTDESIESFLTRRFGRKGMATLPLLDYVGSAVLHGIYATDASKLSVRSIFGFLWTANLQHGSPARAALPPSMNRQHTSLESLALEGGETSAARLELVKARKVEEETQALTKKLGEEYVKEMSKISVVSFPRGVQTLTDAIVRECEQLGVELKIGNRVDSIQLEEGYVKLHGSNGEEAFDRVVSAIPSSKLDEALSKPGIPFLSFNPSSTVAVLNLAMPSSVNLQVPPGFGYLVPRVCAKEGDNPMGLLGVVFDSVAVPGQDSCHKFTMMFGGPFWKTGFEVHDMLEAGQETLFKEKALRLLSKHLSIDQRLIQSDHVYKRLTLQKDCIATYAPGHLGRMDELDAALQGEARLTVIGASYTGVSVNDCVLNATRTAKRLVESENSNHGSVTGLEELVRV